MLVVCLALAWGLVARLHPRNDLTEAGIWFGQRGIDGVGAAGRWCRVVTVGIDLCWQCRFRSIGVTFASRYTRTVSLAEALTPQPRC